MKFVVNRKIMLEYLKSMIRVVPRSNSLQQELRGFLVEANEDDGFLYVTATNQEIAIQRKFKPELETGGSFVMDARLLTDILSVLGEDTVSFEELKPGVVVIKSGTCTYTMNVLNSSRYPRPEIPFPDTTVCLSHLRQFYTKTYAAVKSNASDVLKGIHFDIKPDKLRVMSCNPQNVALATKDVPCGGDMKFTLSKETFSLLASAAGDDELEVGLCGHSIVFMKESLLFSARFIEKEYVNVDRIFDNLKTAYVAKVDFEEMKEQIINICDVASMGSQTSYIKAEFLENKVDVSTQNDTGGGKNSFGIVMVDGTAGKTFYYNAATLKDIFKTVEGTLILRLDVNGYLDVMDRECQYLMMPTPESAVKRQLDKYEENKKKPTICRYCGGKVILTDSSQIYGKDYGKIFLCTTCNAFVGVHKKTEKPLGTLANSILRSKRKETHQVFDKFWKDNNMSRTEGYKWLSEKMGLPYKSTHIGYFEIEDCQKVIDICEQAA